MRKTRESKPFRHSLQAACAFAALVVFLSRAAFAYRPFDGTDADVAKEGEFELELGPVHYFRQNRDHLGDFFSSIILVGGPSRWPLRPVAEFYAERTFGKSTQLSGLLGAIYYANRKIDLDFALREASVDEQAITEIRLGLTWRIDLWGAEGIEDEAHDENNRDPD